MAELIVTSSLDQIDKYKFCNSAQLCSIIKGINKSKLTGEIIFPKKGMTKKGSVDYDLNYLTKLFEKSGEGEYEFEMLKEADEPELQSAWLETFLEKQVCLQCYNSLNSKGLCSKCSDIEN